LAPRARRERLRLALGPRRSARRRAAANVGGRPPPRRRPRRIARFGRPPEGAPAKAQARPARHRAVVLLNGTVRGPGWPALGSPREEYAPGATRAAAGAHSHAVHVIRIGGSAGGGP